MSALDLFASAMGAFILVMIILFPYYLNISPIDPTDLINQLKIEEKKNKELEEKINNMVEIPSIDVVFALDVTGSMGDQIKSFRNDINGIVDILDTLTKGNLGVGVILFGDRMYEAPLTVLPLSDIADDKERKKLFDFINSIAIDVGIGRGGNPEFEEALGLALQAAIKTNWRDVSKERVVVFITDAPGYSEEESAIMAMAKKSGEGGVVISAVMAGNSNETKNFLTRLVVENGGNGKFISSLENSFTSSIIVSIIK